MQVKRILDDRVRPLFKTRKYAAGIAAGVVEIISAIDPDYRDQALPARPSPVTDEQPSYVWIIIILFILINLFGRRRRSSGFLPFLSGFILGGGGSGRSSGGGGFSGGGASSDW